MADSEGKIKADFSHTEQFQKQEMTTAQSVMEQMRFTFLEASQATRKMTSCGASVLILRVGNCTDKKDARAGGQVTQWREERSGCICLEGATKTEAD